MWMDDSKVRGLEEIVGHPRAAFMLLDLPDKSKQALLPGTPQTKEFIVFTHVHTHKCMEKTFF